MASRSAEAADARRVALGLGLGLSVLALVSYLRGRFLLAGVALGLVCLVALGAGARLPAWIAIARVLNGLARMLARGLSRLVLCVLFYGVLTPVGLLLRLMGRRPLDTAWKDGRASYWHRARPRGSDLERYRKLY
jgi:hypothetical protein